jgi:uncharacterized RDD family membrane protein YckC
LTLGVFAASVLRPFRSPARTFQSLLAPAVFVAEMFGPDVHVQHRIYDSDRVFADPFARPRVILPNQGLMYAAQSRQQPSYSSYVFRRPIFRLGQDYTVRADDDVRQILAIAGNVTIEGRVAGDVIVVLGDLRLGSTAVVDGSIVVTAGNVTVAQGAVAHHDLIVVGGTVDTPPGFYPQGEHIAIGSAPLGDWLRGVVPWFTRGLLFGRPIVPNVGWVWVVVLIFFAMSVALNLIFDRPVRACSTVVMERPLAAILAGLIVLVLLGPLFLIMAATVVGILVIPFVACAIAVGWMLGKVGVVRGIGAGLFHQSEADSRAQGLRSFVIGFAAMCLAYMVPVLGLVTWALIGVLGLGSATITFMAALRREPKPKASRAAGAPEPPPPPPGPAPTGEPGAGWADVSSPEPGGAAFMNEAPAHHATAAAADPPAFVPPPSPAAAPAVAMNGASFATFLDRLAAFVLDCLLIAIANQFLRFARADGPLLLWLLIYHVAFWAWMGTTMGGIIVGIKVMRVSGSNLRFVDALVRALASLFSLAALGIGCLWMLQDADRQMWHDKIAGTYVVKVPRNLLLA